jgi:hypothetical protein
MLFEARGWRLTDSDGSWHEPLNRGAPPAGSSDRAFGFLFTAVCAAVAAFAGWEGRASAVWWSIAATVFLLLAVFAAPLLGPFNRAWRWLSLKLSRIVNPFVMGALFFAVLTPVAILMRWAGQDVLGLRVDPARASYWLPRPLGGERPTSMTNQF